MTSSTGAVSVGFGVLLNMPLNIPPFSWDKQLKKIKLNLWIKYLWCDKNGQLCKIVTLVVVTVSLSDRSTSEVSWGNQRKYEHQRDGGNSFSAFWLKKLLFSGETGHQEMKVANLTSSEGGLSERFNDFLNIPVKTPPFSWKTVIPIKFSIYDLVLLTSSSANILLCFNTCAWARRKWNDPTKKKKNWPWCFLTDCRCCCTALCVCPGFPEETTTLPVKKSSNIYEIMNEAADSCRPDIF